MVLLVLSLVALKNGLTAGQHFNPIEKNSHSRTLWTLGTFAQTLRNLRNGLPQSQVDFHTHTHAILIVERCVNSALFSLKCNSYVMFGQVQCSVGTMS